MISLDRRVRAFNLLILLGMAGHFCQLLSEDRFWRPEARARFAVSPGWHVYLPEWVPLALGALLAACVLGAALFRTRPWMLAVAGSYALHYLTYHARIRNHMTLMLSGLTLQSALWLVAAGRGAADLRGQGPHARRVDAWVARGLAAVIVTTYAFAALHKCNANFLALDPDRSAAVSGTVDFLRYGHVTRHPPRWALAFAVYGTIACEAVLPVVAWRFSRLRPAALLALMAFHFPHVSTLAVADYPMLASAYYPALFTPAQWSSFEARLARPTPFALAAVVTALFLQARFVPWWDPVTLFGLVVAALWGYAAAALLPMALGALRRPGG